MGAQQVEIERFDGADLKVPMRVLVRTGHYMLDDKPDDPPRQVVIATFTSMDSEDRVSEDTFIINIDVGKQIASSILDGVRDVEAQAN